MSAHQRKKVLPFVVDEGDAYMHRGRVISATDIFASAVRLLPITIKLSAAETQPERTGGYVQARHAYSGNVFLHVPVGYRDPESMAKYAYFSNEKAARINGHIPRGDFLASQSADITKEWYAGGVVSGRKRHLRKHGLIVTVSGWKAMLDEAYAIAIEVDLGLISWSRARQLAEESESRFLHWFLNEMEELKQAA